jgi:uncharacterized protein (TIGR04255 family)
VVTSGSGVTVLCSWRNAEAVGAAVDAFEVVTPAGVSQQAAGTIFQLRSADEVWRISLSETFVTLETSSYTSREDFCGRLVTILAALEKVAEIPFVTRVGFRYINRVDNPDDFSRLSELVERAVLGGAAVPLGDRARMVHTLSEAVYEVGDVSLLVRWGQLPPGATIDPSVEASANPSWILDLDAFRESRLEFEPSPLGDHARTLSAVAYRFFRWATTGEFLRRFGGVVDA